MNFELCTHCSVSVAFLWCFLGVLKQPQINDPQCSQESLCDLSGDGFAAFKGDHGFQALTVVGAILVERVEFAFNIESSHSII